MLGAVHTTHPALRKQLPTVPSCCPFEGVVVEVDVDGAKPPCCRLRAIFLRPCIPLLDIFRAEDGLAAHASEAVAA